MNINLGSVVQIEALSDLYITKEDGKTVRIFTLGRKYRVEKWLHDLRVTDDSGFPNHVGGEYLVTNFRLHRTTAK